jgi:DNA-binding transcriptional regulator YiaG
MRIKSNTLFSLNASEVRLIRSQLGLSVRQAAYLSGVSVGSWQHYERRGISNGVVVEKVQNWDKERRLFGGK